MCTVLQLPKSTYYYEPKPALNPDEQKLEDSVIEIFRDSRNNYGTRKIKVELTKRSLRASRRKIGRIMKKHGLVSTYTVAQYKPHKADSNESEIQNLLQRKFNQDEPYAVVVSDLTYVRVAGNGTTSAYLSISLTARLSVTAAGCRRRPISSTRP